MAIRDVDITRLKDGNYYGDFIYGKSLYAVIVTVESSVIPSIGIDVETKDSNLKYVNKARSVIYDVIESQSLQVD
jgi:uncharacterized protein with FMN-binding domain